MPRKKQADEHLRAYEANKPIEQQISEILAERVGQMNGWLLITQQLIFPCEAHRHSDREAVVGDLMDALACRCHIVAIFKDGERLTDDEVNTLKTEAISGLGPISRAKVDGKF